MRKVSTLHTYGGLRRALVACAIVAAFAVPTLAEDDHGGCPRCKMHGFTVKPSNFDPLRTKLVASEWIEGTGCPTDAKISTDGVSTVPFSNPACPTGDPKDRKHEGLLLAKTGPQANFAAAGAELKGVRGLYLRELGYDIRKQTYLGIEGSHCGNGSPRFNVTIDDAIVFIGCASPLGVAVSPLSGFTRIRWGGMLPLIGFAQNGPGTCPLGTETAPMSGMCNITGAKVDAIEIIFDEGQDVGPDFFGAAFIDNVDVNGILVGRHGDRDHRDCDGDGKNNDVDPDDDNDGHHDGVDADDDGDGVDDAFDGATTDDDQSSYSMTLGRGETAEFPVDADSNTTTVTAVLADGRAVMEILSPLGAVLASSLPGLGQVVLRIPAAAGADSVRVRNLGLTDVSPGLKLIRSSPR